MTSKLVSLVSVCDFKGGSQPPKKEWSNFKLEGYVRMLQIRDFTQGRNEFEYVKIKKNMNFCLKEDILIARYGASIGKIVTGLEGTYNVALIKAIPNEKYLLKKYLYFYLKSNIFQRFIKSVGSRAAQAGFNKEDLKNAQLYLPSINTQKKIVEVLEKMNATIEKRDSQVAVLDKLAQSKFLEMFGSPNDKNLSYPLVKLSEVCKKITDGTHHSPSMVNKGIPYISAKHLGKGYLDFYSNPSYISIEDHKKIFERCNPQKGDVLYIKDGSTTGIAAINSYDFEFSMLSSLALLKPDLSKINNYYLVNYLNNPEVKENILNQMNGGAIKRLTIKKINNLEVLLPPIELQNKFMIFNERIEEQKKLFKQSLFELENLYNSLIEKAFFGELFQER